MISFRARCGSARSELGAVLVCVEARQRPRNLVLIQDELRASDSDIWDYSAHGFQHNFIQLWSSCRSKHTGSSAHYKLAGLGSSNDQIGIILSSIFM